MSLVIIASQNPAKIQAVKNAFHLCFPHEKSDSVEFVGINAQSGIQHPDGLAETYASAKHRLVFILEEFPHADFLFSLESGIEVRNNNDPMPGLYNFGVVMVRHGKTPNFIAHCETPRFPIPPSISDIMEREKIGFGEASERYFRIRSLKQKEGTIGVLTNERITRSGYFRDALVFAICQFMNQKLWL